MTDRPLSLLLVDSDSIFRLGLQAALQARDDVTEVILQPNLAIALERLIYPVAPPRIAQIASPTIASNPGLPDLVLLRLDSLMRDRGQRHLERSLRQFRQTLPNLPIVGLEYAQRPALALWAQRMNLNGYWARSQSIPELVVALRQVLRGQRVWTLAEQAVNFQANLQGFAPSSLSETLPFGATQRTGIWQRTINSGVRQVEAKLQQLESQRQHPGTIWLDQLWLAGNQRELRTARWLLNRLGAQRNSVVLPEATFERGWETTNSSSVPLTSSSAVATRSSEAIARAWEDFANDPLEQSSVSELPAPTPASTSASESNELTGRRFPLQQSRTTAMTKSQAATLNPQSIGGNPSLSNSQSLSINPPLSNSQSAASSRKLQNQLLDHISQRMPPALINQTDEPLEIDILNVGKRQELFAIVLRSFGELLTDLRLSNLELEFLSEKRSELLLDLWQASLSDFLGRYSSLNINGETVELLPILLQEQPQIEKFILRPLSGIEVLFGTLLLNQPVPLDGVDYRPQSPEAFERLLGLTENLLISVANAVVQPLLNHVAEVETIRQGFYDKRLVSTREIEKFRNNLSWKYRVAHLFREAQDIYESRQWLLRFSDRGIEKLSIYAARRQDLEALTPLQQSVTLALEARDAVSPHLQFFAGWFGNGVVYVLTNIVGRGIGLIGRGIVQGIGSSIQDARNLGKNSSRRKP